MPETTPLIKAALNLSVGAGFDVYGITKVNYYHYPTFYRADHGFKEAFGKRSPSGKNTPHLL